MKSNSRYGLVRGLDDTERIAGLLARFVRLRRSYGTINEYFRLIDALTPADLQAAAKTYLTDANLVLTTLSKDPMPEAMASVPPLASFAPAPAAPGSEVAWIEQKSPLPRLEVKLLFAAGSAYDPPGKEGLAALTAAHDRGRRLAGPAESTRSRRPSSPSRPASTPAWTAR